MKNSIIFWGKMTLKSVLLAVLNLIVYFLIFNFLMGGSVFNDKGCMAGIWFLTVILVGFEINRKNGGNFAYNCFWSHKKKCIYWIYHIGHCYDSHL